MTLEILVVIVEGSNTSAYKYVQIGSTGLRIKKSALITLPLMIDDHLGSPRNEETENK